MPSQLDARRVVESLVGETIRTPAKSKPNRVLAVEGGSAIVATEVSPMGEPVALAKIQEGLDRLVETGETRVSPEAFGGYRRSSAIGAILAAQPAVEVADSPTRVRLAEDSPLRDQLKKACDLVRRRRASEKVIKDDPMYQMMTLHLPAAIRKVVADTAGYKVTGSAGQMNFLWAETAWAAIFDRLVTESAQRGYYIVYLLHPRGESGFLSLNQAVTETRGKVGAGFQDQLRVRASELRSYLGASDIQGLLVEPIELGASGDRSRGYENGNIAAVHYAADEIPHDTILISDLRHHLRLYTEVTGGLAEAEATSDPTNTKLGLESKRYGWHRVAEGRNSSIARRAKQLQGSRCQVCNRDFPQEHGDLGKACTEAHHLTPFSEMDSRPRQLDPLKDFAIVCSNCHRMLHSENPPLSIEVLSDQL